MVMPELAKQVSRPVMQRLTPFSREAVLAFRHEGDVNTVLDTLALRGWSTDKVNQWLHHALDCIPDSVEPEGGKPASQVMFEVALSQLENGQ